MSPAPATAKILLLLCAALAGTLSARAGPLPFPARPAVPPVSQWADPLDPSATYGFESFATTQYIPSVERPFFSDSELAASTRRIDEVRERSLAAQAVIDRLGYISVDLLEKRREISRHAPRLQAAVYRKMIDDFRRDGAHYVSKTLAAEGDGDDAAQVALDPEAVLDPPQTVQEYRRNLALARGYANAREKTLFEIAAALTDVYRTRPARATKAGLKKSFARLDRVLAVWQPPSRAATRVEPVGDTSEPISLRR